MAKRALVIVDVQNDFTDFGPFDPEGNSGWDLIARRIGEYTARYRSDYAIVATTQDWHITPGDHFTTHPVHCMADTEGAALDPELEVGAGVPFESLVDLTVYKGRYADDYSGWLSVDSNEVPLPKLIADAGVTEVDVCGFAADVCCAATVADAANDGLTVRLLTDLSGIAFPDKWDEKKAELERHGAAVEPSPMSQPS